MASRPPIPPRPPPGAAGNRATSSYTTESPFSSENAARRNTTATSSGDGGEKFVVRVYFSKDETFKSFAVTPSSTVRDLTRQFAEKARLGGFAEHFELRQLRNGAESALAPSDRPWDLIQQWKTEGWKGTSDSSFRFIFSMTETAKRRVSLRMSKMVRGGTRSSTSAPLPNSYDGVESAAPGLRMFRMRESMMVRRQKASEGGIEAVNAYCRSSSYDVSNDSEETAGIAGGVDQADSSKPQAPPPKAYPTRTAPVSTPSPSTSSSEATLSSSPPSPSSEESSAKSKPAPPAPRSFTPRAGTSANESTSTPSSMAASPPSESAKEPLKRPPPAKKPPPPSKPPQDTAKPASEPAKPAVATASAPAAGAQPPTEEEEDVGVVVQPKTLGGRPLPAPRPAAPKPANNPTAGVSTPSTGRPVVVPLTGPPKNAPPGSRVAPGAAQVAVTIATAPVSKPAVAAPPPEPADLSGIDDDETIDALSALLYGQLTKTPASGGKTKNNAGATDLDSAMLDLDAALSMLAKEADFAV